MNAKQAERFQQLLIEAVDHYLDTGGTLVRGAFKNHQGCCPLTCLFGDISYQSDDAGNLRRWSKETQQLIGITLSIDEIWAFIAGFDGWSDGSWHMREYPAAALVGKALRYRYIEEE